MVLDKPNDNPKDVYLKCISRVKSTDLKHRLESVADTVSAAAKEYDENGLSGSLYSLGESDDVAGAVTKDEMEKIYTTRMGKKGTPGRPMYDKLKASAPHNKCPICGQRTVSTLDHYLPKTKFPSLVVIPFNLIPSCSDCNKLKHDGVSSTAEGQILHPYYDDVTATQWLFAKVIEDHPGYIRFYVQVEEGFDGVLEARICEHFSAFRLGALYASESGAALADIRYRLDSILLNAGKEEVQKHLADTFLSYQSNHINSWQTAMYQAMANSAWFCDGGFKCL